MPKSSGISRKNKHGGKRAGAGKKPQAFTVLKRRLEAERISDAEYAFALYASVMRDETQNLALRLQCGDWISNRVLGKPKEPNEHTGEVILRVVYGDAGTVNPSP